jgi:hypothetical protein
MGLQASGQNFPQWNQSEPWLTRLPGADSTRQKLQPAETPKNRSLTMAARLMGGFQGAA